MASAKSAPSVPAAKVKAAVALCSVIGAAGVIEPSANSFQLEWALDSGAGENLSSIGAFENQGVPRSWLQEYTTVTSHPLTFETGGGAKAADTTIGFEGDKAGEGIVYMLKNCPYVRSLGKLVQKGFSFFWGPDYEPTIVPPHVPFQVSCDVSQCHVADRVDHCVPIFRETVTFCHGMPASASMDVEPSVPAYDADAVVMAHEAEEVIPDAVEAFLRDDGMLVHSLEGPKGDVPSGSKDPKPKGFDDSVPLDSPKGESSHSKVPIDHLLTHLPAHHGCDVCREAKLRAKAHRRYANQSSAVRDARIIEAPTKFMQRICIDHLESTEPGTRGEMYALACVDQFSGVLFAYPCKSKNQQTVEWSLRHFMGNRGTPVVISDRYPSILAAIKAVGLASDPTPPNSTVKNPLAESTIHILRQGTRSLLLQAGLDAEHWPRAMQCFAFQYNVNTPPSNHDGSLRFDVHRHDHALPAGVEGPEVPVPDVDSKLHLALGYQPEPRLLPYGCFVWYLGKIKDPTAPKSFSPNGKAAMYLGPEVVPGMGCKDVHILLDLTLLTSRGEIREILTRDFIPPTGSWLFPLTRVFMLKSPHALLDTPDPPDDDPDANADDGDVPRNRAITKRRVHQYGPTDLCDGCLNGTYQHTSACRQRFNRLLDAAEPLPRGDEALETSSNAVHEDQVDDIFRLFDTVIPSDVDVEPVDPLDLDLIPECPPKTPSQHEEDTPVSPSHSESSAESWFDESVIGEVVRAPGGVARRKGKGLLIEFCCQENSALSKVAEALDVSYLGITKESFNVEDDQNFHQLICWVQDEIQQGNGPIHLWGSLPCTVWSPWQRMAIHKFGKEYEEKLLQRRLKSLNMVEKFHELAEVVQLSKGGSSSFEWSKDAEGWQEPVVQSCMNSLGMKSVQFDGCAFDLELDGKRPKRQWIVQTTNERLVKELETKKCSHEKGFHDLLEGSLTKKSGFYNMSMAICLISTLFPGVILDQVPACPVMPFRLDPHRTRLQDFHTPEICVLATIHKLLSRDEMRNDPMAIEAIKEEGRGVRAKDVWLDSTVMEKSERLAKAKREGKVIHIAEVMPIASIKHWESPDRRRYKGRLVFRGDVVKDTWGAAAQFGALYSAPTNTQAINLAVFYGLLKGHKLTAADCTRAFLQAMLLMDEETYVVLPQELWLESWHGKYRQPTVRLQKALYGHPLASACWEMHLRQVLVGDLGLKPVDGHPSVFRCDKTGLLVVVYVDDVLLSGPEQFHDRFWSSLRKYIELDDPEPLNQFIGRNHVIEGPKCIFNMTDYCQQVIDLYVEVVEGKVNFRNVSTPYVNENMLTQQDFEVQGQVSQKASSVLMKLLWVCRLARPDLAYAINSLSTQVTRWSRNSDKQLYRLVSYLYTTKDLCLVSQVYDEPENCTIDLFCDADLGGCPFTARSTSGLYLVIRGDKGTFCPITWKSRRQTHVARSTADAELNSLAEGLHEELLPIYQLLVHLLGKRTPKPVAREDNSAVVQSIRKGYSVKLRHLARTPKLSLASLNEACSSWCKLVQTPTAEQLGDYFTKALAPGKFDVSVLGLEYQAKL